MKSDSISEKTSVAITMIGTTLMTLPMMVVTASNGANAAMLVRTAKTTGLATSIAPASAASSPSSPDSYSV